MFNPDSFLLFLTRTPNQYLLAEINHNLLLQFGLCRSQRKEVLQAKAKSLEDICFNCATPREFQEMTGYSKRASRWFFQKYRPKFYGFEDLESSRHFFQSPEFDDEVEENHRPVDSSTYNENVGGDITVENVEDYSLLVHEGSFTGKNVKV